MLVWRSRLQFRVYNPGKITKYGILGRMVCESSTGYICNLQIYDGMLHYVTFSKNNPNSRKSFLDFMSDITENLLHQMLYHHHHLTSRKARVEHLHLLQQNVPQKMIPLAGLMKY